MPRCRSPEGFWELIRRGVSVSVQTLCEAGARHAGFYPERQWWRAQVSHSLLFSRAGAEQGRQRLDDFFSAIRRGPLRRAREDFPGAEIQRDVCDHDPPSRLINLCCNAPHADAVPRSSLR